LGLYASLLLRPVLAPRQLTLVPLAMGVGIVRALRTAGISRVGLKWPNDLLVQGKKLGGILSETRGEAGRAGVVVGIGLNVNQDEDDFPEHLQGKATSLKRESGKLWDLMAVLGEVLASCEKEYDALQAEGPEPLLKRFESLSVFERGDRLRVESPQGVVEGRYAGLGCSGELLLKVGSAPPRAFHFGDVARVREE
jgi:BirA family biotin operon repressor/biotin-[acetyl-CoA-carboxylase] ligase